MFINLSYGEILQCVTALKTIENVYESGVTKPLCEKLENVLEYMDNAPVTEVYPFIQGVGTVNT